MTDETTIQRTKLLKGYRWPKDRYGLEIDVGDFINFIGYTRGAEVWFGVVVKIGKTGKLIVQNIPFGPKDVTTSFEIKHSTDVVKLSKIIKDAVIINKLSKD